MQQIAFSLPGTSYLAVIIHKKFAGGFLDDLFLGI